MTSRDRSALLLAVVWAFVFAVALYAATRIAQVLFVYEPNPATILVSARSGYYARALLALFGGGLFGFSAYAYGRSDARRLVRPLRAGMLAAALLLALQSLFAP
jgi:hypothetical protein